MAAAYKLANAPCSWGVDFADRPENPAWSRVLDEASSAGFSAIDLGPIGYFPTDPSKLKDELAQRNLEISAGGLFDPLTDPHAFDRIIEKTRQTCAMLKALGAPRLVIIDRVSDARGKYAGRSHAAPRLCAEDWKAMMRRIIELANIAKNDYGVQSYLHAHAGCYIEYADELDRAMNDLPDDLVGLCVDTGHAAYAGIDPVGLIRQYGSRTGHMHLKNVDGQVLAACIADGTGFFDAIARGVFCPLRQGMVDFVAVREALTSIHYQGMVVVEQDVDPTGNTSPLNNARENFDYLAAIGMSS